MLYLIRQSKLEKVFNKYISLHRLNKINLGIHTFYTYPTEKNKCVIRYDKGDPILIVFEPFYNQVKDFFSFDDKRTKEFFKKWFRRQSGKKINEILKSQFQHQVKQYNRFPT